MHPDPPAKPWILWQLIDSAFPVGSFAHSNGLEAAMQLGEVDGGESVKQFVFTSLRQCARSACPFAIKTSKNPEKYLELDELLNAMLTSAISNKASRTQGQALLATACNIWETELLQDAKKRINHGFNTHLPVVFGLLASHLKIEANDLVNMFLYLHARGILSAAVRLNIIGPIEAQRIQFGLTELSESLVQTAMDTPVEKAMQTAPVLDLLQAQHDRLYSRLFIT